MLCASDMHAGAVCTIKHGNFLYSNVSFQLHLSGIDRLDEGVEFSIRMNSDGVWIPITLTTLKNISIVYSEDDDVEIREYHVKPIILHCPIGIIYHSVQMCDFGFQVNFIQFRWLQTHQINASDAVNNAWTLDNVHMSVYDGNDSVALLQDSFNEPDLK